MALYASASTEPTLPQGLALPSPSTRSLRIDDSKLSEPFQLYPTIAWPWRDAWLVPNSRSSTFHFRRVRRVVLWYCHDGPDESVWERYICRWGLLGLRWDLRELESVGTHGLTTFPWRSLISVEVAGFLLEMLSFVSYSLRSFSGTVTISKIEQFCPHCSHHLEMPSCSTTLTVLH